MTVVTLGEEIPIAIAAPTETLVRVDALFLTISVQVKVSGAQLWGRRNDSCGSGRNTITDMCVGGSNSSWLGLSTTGAKTEGKCEYKWRNQELNHFRRAKLAAFLPD